MPNGLKGECHFERQILRFVCVIGLFRMGVEVYSNLVRNTGLYSWVVDFVLISVLALVLVLSFSTIKIRYLSYPMSIIVVLLLTVSLVNRGGVYGRWEYNYIVLIVVLGMIHTGRSQVAFLVFGLVSLVAVVVLWEVRFDWIEPFVISFANRPMHFAGSAIICAMLACYLRYGHEREERLLKQKQEALKARATEMDKENTNLLLQQDEFEAVNVRLESEIRERRIKLESQNKALRGFIEISLKEFYPPMKNTISAIDQIKGHDAGNENLEMLVRSGYALEKAYERMTSKMKKNLK